MARVVEAVASDRVVVAARLAVVAVPRLARPDVAAALTVLHHPLAGAPRAKAPAVPRRPAAEAVLSQPVAAAVLSRPEVLSRPVVLSLPAAADAPAVSAAAVAVPRGLAAAAEAAEWMAACSLQPAILPARSSEWLRAAAVAKKKALQPLSRTSSYPVKN